MSRGARSRYRGAREHAPRRSETGVVALSSASESRRAVGFGTRGVECRMSLGRAEESRAGPSANWGLRDFDIGKPLGKGESESSANLITPSSQTSHPTPHTSSPLLVLQPSGCVRRKPGISRNPPLLQRLSPDSDPLTSPCRSLRPGLPSACQVAFRPVHPRAEMPAERRGDLQGGADSSKAGD